MTLKSGRIGNVLQVGLLLALAGYYYFFLYRTPVSTLQAGLLSLKGVSITPFNDGAAAPVEGPPVSFESLQGKVLFVHFWASWCTSCRAELPTLRQLRQRFSHERLQLIGVAIQDTPADVLSFLKTTHFPMAVYLDLSGAVSRTLNINSIPQSVLVDKKGFVRLRMEGALRESHFNVINKMLEELGV